MFAVFAAAALLQAAQPAAASVAKPAVDKPICKTLPQTGSLFAGPKECHTRSEWEAINAEARDNTGSYQQRSHQMGGNGG